MLATAPTFKLFNSFKELSDYLNKLDDSSQMVDLTEPGQLILDKDLCTGKSNLKLTTTSLNQVCKILCPGLTRVITDLSGLSVASFDRTPDVKLAVNIYNSIIKSRFSLLENRLLLVNNKQGTIDGILSQNYKRLTNLQFYESLNTAIESNSRRDLSFYRAEIIGRLMIVIMGNKSKTIITSPDKFYSGIYASNDEGGDTGVKAAECIIRPVNHTRAIKLARMWKAAHTGKHFINRVNLMLQNLLEAPVDTMNLHRIVKGTQNKNLGFKGSPVADKKIWDDRFDLIVTRLIRKDIPANLAEKILTSALYSGSSPNNSGGVSRDSSVWSKRTIFDLATSLMRDAVDRTLLTRELLERVAFKLLTNNFPI